MAREDWVYLNFEKSLMDTVDKVVESNLKHGAKKYHDRKDFTIKAIQKLLDSELKEVCSC